MHCNNAFKINMDSSNDDATRNLQISWNPYTLSANGLLQFAFSGFVLLFLKECLLIGIIMFVLPLLPLILDSISSNSILYSNNFLGNKKHEWFWSVYILWWHLWFLMSSKWYIDSDSETLNSAFSKRTFSKYLSLYAQLNPWKLAKI